MKIAVIGAGSWGTALAFTISKNNKLTWWVRREKLAHQIRAKNRNTKYLTNCKLNTSKIKITTNLEEGYYPFRSFNSCYTFKLLRVSFYKFW